jgi:hypothetical protein
MSERGLDVGPPLKEFRGILSGVPTTVARTEDGGATRG